MKIFIKARIRAFVQEELPKLLDLLDRIVDAINASPYVDYEDIEVTTPTSANTDFKVTLKNLDRTPKFYEVIKKDKACDIYTAPASSTTQWGNNTLYLRCTVASATIMLRVT